MHGTLADVEPGAIDGNATACSQPVSADFDCNILQDPHWFGVLCRWLWPSKPWLMLCQLLGAKERTAHNYASGTHPPPATVLRDLLRTDHGYRALVWLMRFDPPEWWVELQRLVELGRKTSLFIKENQDRLS